MPSSHDDEVPHVARRSWLFYAISSSLLLIALILLGGAVTVGIITSRVRAGYFAAQRAIGTELARIRALGEPITSDEMYTFHRVPDGVLDATPAWLRVLATFDHEQLAADIESLPLFGEGPTSVLKPNSTPSEQAAVAEFLAEYDATVRTALEVAQLEGQCRLPIKFEQAYADERIESLKIEWLIRLLGLRVQVQHAAGENDAAIESLSAMVAASNALENQPSGLDHGRRLVTMTRIVQHVLWLINDVQLDDRQLATLQMILDCVDYRVGITTALIGDRAMMYQSFLTYTPPGVVQLTEGDRTGKEPGQPFDCELGLKYSSQLIAVSREPFPEALERAKAIEDELTRCSQEWSEFDRRFYSDTLRNIPLDVLRFGSLATSIANRDTMRAAIAAERYRLRSGAFPLQLADMVPDYLPEIPRDPFNGEPLRMRLSEKSLVVYSVGDDKQDDGGSDEEESSTKDIAVPVYIRKGRIP